MKIIDQLKAGTGLVAGVDIRVTGTGTTGVFSLVRFNGSTMEPVESGDITDPSFQKIRKNKNIRVVVVMNGKGVIGRKIPLLPDQNAEVLAHQVMPNAFASDFYINCTPSGPGTQWCFLARKSMVDQWIEDTIGQACFVTAILLGPLPGILLQNAGLLTPPFLLPGWQVEGSDQSWSGLHGDERTSGPGLSSGSTTVSFPYLLALGAALLPAGGSPGIETFGAGKFKDAASEFRNRKILKRNAIAITATICLVLLADHFIARSLLNTSENLRQQLSESQVFLQQLDSVQQKAAEYRMLLDKTGWTNSSKVSWFSDQVGSVVPEEILLTELKLFQPDESLSTRKSSSISNKIIVSGTVESSQVLNQFIKRLKQLGWAEDISIVTYGFERKSELAHFTIHLQIAVL